MSSISCGQNNVVAFAASFHVAGSPKRSPVVLHNESGLMRLAFLAGGAISDRRAWSGTIYYAHRALAARFDVVPIEMPAMNRALRGLRKIARPVGIDLIREFHVSSVMSDHAARRIIRAGVDAVFVLGASHIAAGLVGRFPVFHCSDATFAAMVDYHGEFTGLSQRTIRNGNALEARVINGSAAAFLASEWAAHSARDDYGRRDGVYVAPFGANLDSLPSEDTWKRKSECSLVLVGVNWYGKGADIALETTRLLRQRGIPAILHVAGCSPPAGVSVPDFVKLYGFLRKDVPDEYSQLTALIAGADFLILPTRFEAFGIVFCEAAAYGTPSIARKIGGISSIITDGVTGALVAPEAQAGVYADRIQEMWSDERRYEGMRRSAFARSRDVLNWNAWGERVSTIINGEPGVASSVRSGE